MCKGLSKIISRDSGPFWQFVKYGAIGAASTLVQLVVFYLLASTFVKCLGPDDWAGKFDFLREEGAEVVYLPRTPEISTTQIKNDLNKS